MYVKITENTDEENPEIMRQKKIRTVLKTRDIPLDLQVILTKKRVIKGLQVGGRAKKWAGDLKDGQTR